jgi:hypothetical protein
MAVVINEFEVVPADGRSGQSEVAATARDEKPKDPKRELEQLLRQRAAHATRTRGV